eukprot:sb/3464263/
MPGKKTKKSPKEKKERAPRKKKTKEDAVPKKKREKKRKIDNVPALNQFDFPFVDKGGGGPPGVFPGEEVPQQQLPPPGFMPDSRQQGFYRQASEPVMPNMGQPYVKRTNSENLMYKAEDFFASAHGMNGSPVKYMPGDQQYTPNQTLSGSPGSASLFSPTSSENLSGEAGGVGVDDDMDNLDLGVLNELDGCDLTDEQEVLKQLPKKKGRKPKDPNKPRAPPKKRKPKVKQETSTSGVTSGGVPPASQQPPAVNGMYNIPPGRYMPPGMVPAPQFPPGPFPGPEGFSNTSPNKPPAYFYGPPGAEHFQGSPAKISMMPANLQPGQMVPPPMSQLGPPPMAHHQVPCQYTPEKAVSTPLSHYSPSQNSPATGGYPMPSYTTPYAAPPPSLVETDPLKQALVKGEDQSDGRGGAQFAPPPSYPGPPPNGQFGGGEMYPTSLYPEHSFPTPTTATTPAPASAGVPPPPTNYNQFHMNTQYRTF